MTSQITVYNALGVGLASDTVTTHFSAGGIKTMPNAKKIVPLPNPHRIALMFSGNVHQSDTHIALLLNEWAQSNEKPFSSLEEYPKDFLKWFQSAASKYVSAEVESETVENLLRNRFRTIRSEVAMWSQGASDEDEIENILNYRLDRNLKKLFGAQPFIGFSDADAVKTISTLKISLETIFKHYLGHFPGFMENDQRLKEIAVYQISRFMRDRDDTTIGFVGFGSDDLYARDIKVVLRGRYGGVSIARIGEPFGSPGGRRSGAIHTFAQDDAIWGFLKGIYPELQERILSYMWQQISELDKIPNSKEVANNLYEGLEKFIESYKADNYATPLIKTLEGLSLKGLAELAANLVGMQATRSAGSAEPASVGGLIESAIIDRRDGFRWVTQLP